MLRLPFRLLFVLVSIVALAACEHADPIGVDEPGAGGATFTQVQTSVFSTSCALSGCHTGDFPPQGLNLSAGQAYANLVNVPSQEVRTLQRVEPGDPDASYLYMKITGASGIAGERMPLGRAPLSAAQIELVRSWIAAGAANN